MKDKDKEDLLNEIGKRMSINEGRKVTREEVIDFINSQEIDNQKIHKDLMSWVKKVNAMMIESASTPKLQLLKVLILLDLFKELEKKYKKKDKLIYKSARELVDSFYKSINAEQTVTSLEEAKKRLYENGQN
jgi:hypothetical protein